MKRIFSLLMVVCMLAAMLVVPANAYDTTAEGLWPSAWHADLNIAFDDATAAPLRPMLYDRDHNLAKEPEALNTNLAAQSRKGALYLTSSASFASTTEFLRNTLLADQPNLENHNFVTSAGSTVDFGVKFNDLPKLTDAILEINDKGEFVTDNIGSNARGQLGRYTGLNLNIHSMTDYINADGSVKLHAGGTNKGKPYSTEYNISFVAYDNEVLGTNAAVIFTSGSATSWTSWTSSVREICFLNLNIGRSAPYHRFTFSTDFSAGLKGEDMVTMYMDGVKTATFSAPAYRGYSATLGDYVTVGLYTNGYFETNSKGHVTMGVTLDQLSVYGTALTPASAEMSTFNETAPLYTEDYAAALEKAKAIDPTLYSKKSWKVVADALAAAEKLPAVEEMNLENVKQEELDAITLAINTGIENLKYNDFNSVINEKRLLIPFAFHNAEDATGYAYSWTNSTTIFTDPNYNIADYVVNNTQLNDFTSVVFEPTDVAGQYKVVAVYPRGKAQAARTINKAPEGGFIIYNHANIPGTSTSRYASQLFGDANAEIISQIQVGDLAVLENVTLNKDRAATLQTSGLWRSRYDPQCVATSSGDTCDLILTKYPVSGPVWRDQFEDFETLSALVLQLPVGADKEAFNEIKGKIDAAIETDYSAESWKALQDVLGTVNLSAENLNQDMIDEWTEALVAAYEGLVKLDVPDQGTEKDPSNSGTGEATGDAATVFVTLGVIGLLAIACMATLIIGRRRGNF